MVYLRNCLTTPFIIETCDGDIDYMDEENEEGGEKFIKEKTELFPLVLCIMLQHREMFDYLWQTSAFIYHDLHLVILVNFIFDS